MSVMEFVLVAYAILIGLGVAEILQGFADLIRAESVQISRRLLGYAGWVLMLFLQIWWAIWGVRDREAWVFIDFLIFLLPVILLYVSARIAFPRELDGADLPAYYERLRPALWGFAAAVYVSFGLIHRILYDDLVVPSLLASQLGLATVAIVAGRVRDARLDSAALVLMFIQLLWRGFAVVVGG